LYFSHCKSDLFAFFSIQHRYLVEIVACGKSGMVRYGISKCGIKNSRAPTPLPNLALNTQYKCTAIIQPAFVALMKDQVVSTIGSLVPHGATTTSVSVQNRVPNSSLLYGISFLSARTHGFSTNVPNHTKLRLQCSYTKCKQSHVHGS